MQAVLDALARFEEEAVNGSPPLAVFLWDEKIKKPISEIRLSDFLKFYLKSDLAHRRVIVNREVEIRNLHDFGIGERTDLLIQGTPEPGIATEPIVPVVVEVKGCGNVKPEDMENQLKAKNLDGEERRHGIYLVGWYGEDDAKPTGTTLSLLRNDLEIKAATLCDRRCTIVSRVLELRPPGDRGLSQPVARAPEPRSAEFAAELRLLSAFLALQCPVAGAWPQSVFRILARWAR